MGLLSHHQHTLAHMNTLHTREGGRGENFFICYGQRGIEKHEKGFDKTNTQNHSLMNNTYRVKPSSHPNYACTLQPGKLRSAIPAQHILGPLNP